MKFEIGKSYKITWKDAYCIHNETDIEAVRSIKEGLIGISRGILLHRQYGYLLIKQNDFPNTTQPRNDYIAIPESWITSARVLE